MNPGRRSPRSMESNRPAQWIVGIGMHGLTSHCNVCDAPGRPPDVLLLAPSTQASTATTGQTPAPRGQPCDPPAAMGPASLSAKKNGLPAPLLAERPLATQRGTLAVPAAPSPSTPTRLTTSSSGALPVTASRSTPHRARTPSLRPDAVLALESGHEVGELPPCAQDRGSPRRPG